MSAPSREFDESRPSANAHRPDGQPSTTAPSRRFYSDCDGEGWIITNPSWPNGNRPYRERCGGCDKCEPEQS